MKSIVSLSHVSKVYGSGENEVRALDDVSLNIEQGDLVAVVGQSGSGKSTLMHIIGALDMPTSGSVSIAGRSVNALRRAELAPLRAKNIGFVFQGFNLIPTQTALENVMEAARYGGMPAQAARQRSREILENVGLADRATYFPNQLSGGQQQRVAIARALVNRPALILGDEPTGELDSKNAKAIMGILITLNREQGQTVVVVTHNQEIAVLCRTVVTVKDGKISEVVKNSHA